IVDHNREILEINTELDQLDIRRRISAAATTAELERQARAIGQMTSDIESELASSLGNAGQAGGIDLGRRIQDEFKNVLLNTNKVTPELQLIAELVNDANTNFEELTFLLDAANIDILALS